MAENGFKDFHRAKMSSQDTKFNTFPKSKNVVKEQSCTHLHLCIHIVIPLVPQVSLELATL